jgi:release factor glutamine methyltransferase
MKLPQLKSLFHSELEALYPKTEIDSFFNILTEYKMGLTRIDRALQPSIELIEAQSLFFNEALSKLKKEFPVQYITGKTEFYSLPFNVNPDVLIPRPETEELVEWIQDDAQDSKNIHILDIGTGSGCIAISLAKNITNATVYALDFSESALHTAQENAELNGVKITFIHQDILKADSLTENFDIIVSNPPYVRELEKKEIQKNVLNNEPHSALFVDNNNPLVFYNKITDLALTHLKPHGSLYFEINQYLGNEMLQMLADKGFSNTQLKKDIFGNDRMTKSKFE